MSVGTEVKLFLDNLGTLGTIIVGTMNPSPDILGAIFEYAGRVPLKGFGDTGIRYERPSFQIMFRGAPADYAGPLAKCEIAWAALAEHQPGVITGGSDDFLSIDPKQSPFSLGKDNKNRFELVCNFWTLKVP